MKKAIILHGTLGSPEGNWFQWLRAELEAQGLQVWVPQLPHPEKPSLREEKRFIQVGSPFELDEETILIGHSSGAILALILAQENLNTIGSIVAVSVFHDNSLNWDPNSELFDIPFNWEILKNNVDKYLFIHSDDDPYVPLDQASFVAANCNASISLIPGQGHFNLEKSLEYRKFPKLLEFMKKAEIL